MNPPAITATSRKRKGGKQEKSFPAFQFTNAAIEMLPPAKRVCYYDTEVPHLAIRVGVTGQKVFVFKASGRKTGKKMVYITLGKFPEMSVHEARTKASAANNLLKKRVNPTRTAMFRNESLTFGEMFGYYYTYAKGKGIKWQKVQEHFDRYLSHWRHTRIVDIHRSDIQQWHSTLAVNRGQTTANRALELFKAVFNRCRKMDLINLDDPTQGTNRFKLQPRDRFLQDNELPAFFRVLAETENETFRDLVLMCLFTAARVSNVCAMNWKDINMEQGVWYIPAAQTKSKRSQILPLIDEAMVILQRRQATVPGEWVFPSPHSNSHYKRPSDREWRKLRKEAGLDNFRMHDLRRSMASWQAITGTELPVISKTLGHQRFDTTGIYARLNLTPVQKSMAAAAKTMIAKSGMSFIDSYGDNQNAEQVQLPATIQTMTPELKALLAANGLSDQLGNAAQISIEQTSTRVTITIFSQDSIR